MHDMAPQPTDKAPTRALLTEFDRWHRLICDGVPAVIHGGKDAKLIAGLYRTHGEDLVRELMADYFQSRDAFIQQAGYTVGVFRLEGRGVQLFERIDGDYFVILGMPLIPLLGALRERRIIPE